MFLYKDKSTLIETDNEGYLKNFSLWNKTLAKIIAEKEGIILSSEIWEVILFVRNFYLEFNTSPTMRMLVRLISDKFGKEKGNSLYLHQLFPKGPAKQVCKIAGLPRPVRCI